VPQLDERLKMVATWIRNAGKLVALTGAGISTESGIPDFRGPEGVWTKDPGAERLARIDVYMSDSEIRRRAWRMRLEYPGWTAEPSAGHHALAMLERKGHLQTLITQNVDGLHALAGNSSEVLIEIHGHVRDTICTACGERKPMRDALDRVRKGESDPPCNTCGGVIKSATVSFGQSLDANDLGRSQSAAASCDVFLAIGTSLVVFPVALLPRLALDAGAKLVIVTAESTPYDSVADMVINHKIGDVLPSIAELV
jgi:NAD-dependent deacetylase